MKKNNVEYMAMPLRKQHAAGTRCIAAVCRASWLQRARSLGSGRLGVLVLKGGLLCELQDLPLFPNVLLFLSVLSRVRVRYQKRQKLQFETKLGMNSPF